MICWFFVSFERHMVILLHPKPFQALPGSELRKAKGREDKNILACLPLLGDDLLIQKVLQAELWEVIFEKCFAFPSHW